MRHLRVDVNKLSYRSVMRLAKSKGIKLSHVSFRLYENGLIPAYDVMLAIAYIYNIDVSALMFTDLAHEYEKEQKALAAKLEREQALKVKLGL